MPILFGRFEVPSITSSIMFGLLLVMGGLADPQSAGAATEASPPPAAQVGQTRATSARTTADHSKFRLLQRDFQTGPEVTEACLVCHTEAAKQIHRTTHWTWAFTNPITGQELGKKNVINNFCVATATNFPRCTSCHIGYGWKDETFDFASEKNVDCLVCHDTTGSYRKFPAGAGHPAYQDTPFMGGVVFKAVDLQKVAQSVGQPSRQNCGACHFFGGGGDAVKHGDLDSTMTNPDRELDVHMNADGLNFACTACHTAGSHDVTGSRYVTKAVDRLGIDVPGHTDDTRATCESCHGLAPHPSDNHPKLNDHTDKVACTTCHVPEFARGGKKTKMWWDWSTAGQLTDGKPAIRKNADGDVVYDGMKGDFRWEADVVPEYRWFDGRIDYTLLGQTIDPSGVVEINRLSGHYGDPDSRIWPFKVMRGRQPYDKQNKVLAVPHLFGKDDTAFWGNFDWNKAIAAGLQAPNVPYSGEYDFVETRYYWPILHMVAPKEKALACNDCHTKTDGRLAALTGFYMPGRDSYPWLSRLGWAGAALTLLGVIVHLLVRLVMAVRRR